MSNIVYELLIDYDGTTRSRYLSHGLFSTKEKAKTACERVIKSRSIFGGYRIEPRTVT